MKNLIIIIAIFLLPLALVGQSEVENVRIEKNSITGSFFVGDDSGIAIDYRRRLAGNNQLVLGLQDTGFGSPDLVIGLRKTFKPASKLSFSVGADALLRKRNGFGGGVVSSALRLFPKPKSNSLRVVGGAYYKITDNLDFMTELHMRGLVSTLFSGNATTTLNFGLKYGF